MQAIIIFLLVLTPLSWAIAAEPLSIVINEIAWMGTKTSSADEWIELYNPTGQDISLEGWGLYEQGGETLIEPLTGVIKGESYYLIERTDDNTVPNVEASQPSTSWGGHGLNNNGEHLQLLDNNSNVVDETDCREGWFAGKGKPEYKTMERKDALLSGNDSSNWQTSKEPGGTPKAENSLIEIEPELPAQSPKDNEAGPPACETCGGEPIAYPSNIFINEILPSPEGADAENEWIEIFNGNNLEIDISEWKIRDTIGATKTYTIPEGTKIKANGFLVLSRPESKITLQNSGDGLELLNPIGEVVHEANYPKAPLGQSFNRISAGWTWGKTLTPGEINIITPLETLPSGSSQESPEKETNKSSQSKAREEDKKSLAAQIEGQLPKSLNPSTIFLIALTIAISSAIIVLILKKRTEETE